LSGPSQSAEEERKKQSHWTEGASSALSRRLLGICFAPRRRPQSQQQQQQQQQQTVAINHFAPKLVRQPRGAWLQANRAGQPEGNVSIGGRLETVRGGRKSHLEAENGRQVTSGELSGSWSNSSRLAPNLPQSNERSLAA